eukprot:15438579-Alexandrium_andersonii.AAC.1
MPSFVVGFFLTPSSFMPGRFITRVDFAVMVFTSCLANSKHKCAHMNTCLRLRLLCHANRITWNLMMWASGLGLKAVRSNNRDEWLWGLGCCYFGKGGWGDNLWKLADASP